MRVGGLKYKENGFLMTEAKGKIVLMGSGELTATMVEVHKELIAGLKPPQSAVFLDTPAGFQLNAAQIAETARHYFNSRVNHPLHLASFKSADSISTYEAETAYYTLRKAQFVLIGPGSPTYAVRQLKKSPIPDIFIKLIGAGGCLVAASAAALTVGSHTLPVYEIYKVGENLHWVAGLDILGKFGINLVVVPHWNNAEGGTHDTRRCFMGVSRFQFLEAQLPETAGILGLDEHTACIIDLRLGQVTVRGIGRVIVKYGQRIQVFAKGDVFPVGVLQNLDLDYGISPERRREPLQKPNDQPNQSAFWKKIHAIDLDFQAGLAKEDSAQVTSALLELDRVIWQGKQDLESDETVSEAREMLRDQIVGLGSAWTQGEGNAAKCLTPVVDALLKLREQFRVNKQFAEADALRACLHKAHIIVEDTPQGACWRFERS
jgi:hypothetical protein